jgi:hypothetical protein
VTEDAWDDLDREFFAAGQALEEQTAQAIATGPPPAAQARGGRWSWPAPRLMLVRAVAGLTAHARRLAASAQALAPDARRSPWLVLAAALALSLSAILGAAAGTPTAPPKAAPAARR